MVAKTSGRLFLGYSKLATDVFFKIADLIILGCALLFECLTGNNDW